MLSINTYRRRKNVFLKKLSVPTSFLNEPSSNYHIGLTSGRN